MFFLLSSVFPFMLKWQQGFLAGSLPVWVRMKWLNTQVGMVFQLGWLSCVVAWGEGATPAARRGVQGRDETQESPEGKYTDRADTAVSKVFPAPVGWVTMVWGCYGADGEVFLSPLLASRAAQLSPPSQGRVWGGIQEEDHKFHGAALVLPSFPQL